MFSEHGALCRPAAETLLWINRAESHVTEPPSAVTTEK